MAHPSRLGKAFRVRASEPRYLLELRRHMTVAPIGYGKLAYSHGEALMAGAALVCQDPGHVQMFPCLDRENAIFCRPDLSDLRDIVQERLRDEDLRRRVAREGRGSCGAAQWREHLYDGIEVHIREALGDAPGSRVAAS